MGRLNYEQVVNVVDCLYDKLCMPDLKRKDGEPLKHAKWVICSDGYYPYCSNCNNEPPSKELTEFCPRCGAKMDKECDAK